MKQIYAIGLALLVLSVGFAVFYKKGILMTRDKGVAGVAIALPKPKLDGALSIEKAIGSRRSVREYKKEPMTREQLSQLLWAAQGVTSRSQVDLIHDGLRASPSAGALYPLELYVVVGVVTDLEPGVYKYTCKDHTLTLVASGDKRSALQGAALGQDSVGNGAIALVMTGIEMRTGRKYGNRARRYILLECGHAAQNVYLQAESLGLGTVVVGAFDDISVQEIVGCKSDEKPFYIMPIGVV